MIGYALGQRDRMIRREVVKGSTARQGYDRGIVNRQRAAWQGISPHSVYTVFVYFDRKGGYIYSGEAVGWASLA